VKANSNEVNRLIRAMNRELKKSATGANNAEIKSRRNVTRLWIKKMKMLEKPGQGTMLLWLYHVCYDGLDASHAQKQ
jgi:hypothetical protein